jgi:hypothetical protein
MKITPKNISKCPQSAEGNQNASFKKICFLFPVFTIVMERNTT